MVNFIVKAITLGNGLLYNHHISENELTFQEENLFNFMISFFRSLTLVEQ